MKHIDHVGIVVADEARSTAFYTDVMQFNFIERIPMPNGNALVFLRAGTSQEAGLFELIVPPGGAQPVAPVPQGTAGIRHVCMHVESLDAWIERLKQHDVPITSGPTTLTFPSGKVRLLFCTDPDGVSLELYERENEV